MTREHQIIPPEAARIGAGASAWVEDGEAIALDASTTGPVLVRDIKGRRELGVITNGLIDAMALLDTPGIAVLMPGGFLRRDSVSLVGHEGNILLEQFNFQNGFWGAK